MTKVLTFADLHLRETVPSCVDATQTEWMGIQRKALSRVAEIAMMNHVEQVLAGGDIFHSDRSTSFECVTMFQEFANILFEHDIPLYILAGNHDLPQHSSTNVHKSAVGILFNSGNILDMSENYLVKGCNFDEDDYEGFRAIFKHVLCIPEKDKPSFVECLTPQDLLDRYKSARFVFLGDYHRNFVYRGLDGRLVVNSGCLTKQAVDFEGYETGVYVTDLDSGEVQWFPVNVEQRFVRNGKKEGTSKGMEDFVNGIKRESVTLDFVGSLRNELPKQDEKVREKVEDWIEKVGQ